MKVVKVNSLEEATESAKNILYEKVDKETLLFLSGGSTPKNLYKGLTEDKKIYPGVVGMVDERFGEKFHKDSNEKMIEDTGFLDYLKSINAKFYPILQENLLREESAKDYEKTLEDLFSRFKKSIAVMGIGADGHIAGIKPEILNSKSEALKQGSNSPLVYSYYDNKMIPPERISMTFAALSKIDFFLVLALGKEKENALLEMKKSGDIKEIPARFYVQNASNKTVIITDQSLDY